MGNTIQGKHQDAGKSSFDLINKEIFFRELDLKSGINFLDAGCGNGQYSLAISEIIGNGGTIYAIDRWKEGITQLKENALAKNINNIKAMIGDISDDIPIEKGCIDVCLMSTVMHGLVQHETANSTLEKITEALNPQGLLAIVEFKKIDVSPGPPIAIRLTPEEVEEIVIPFGFKKERIVDIGKCNYMITFLKNIT